MRTLYASRFSGLIGAHKGVEMIKKREPLGVNVDKNSNCHQKKSKRKYM